MIRTQFKIASAIIKLIMVLTIIKVKAQLEIRPISFVHKLLDDCERNYNVQKSRQRSLVMKISKEKAAANRAALIETASRLFRQKGIDGVGVAEISKSAGLTHGALYAHFPSKEALAAEALAWSLEQSNTKLYSGTVDGEPDLERFVSDYLSVDKLDNYADTCAMAASASEIGRQDVATSSTYTEGYLVLVRAFERRVAANNPGADALATAMGIVAAMVGGLSVARATAKARPEVSAQALRGVRHMIDIALGKPV